ncbi:MAG: alpha/beta fold hydrolase [Myxococcales bacterium]|nr:alpha/beta fold hydrolase [Myxococcales bacterium]
MPAAGEPLAFDLWLEPFALESGPHLPCIYLRGWWWGPAFERQRLAAGTVPVVHVPGQVVRRDLAAQARLREASEEVELPLELDPDIPTVLVIHALTADATVGGPSGWWSPLVGPNKPLDPTVQRILCFNNLGSCYGSFGPADHRFPTIADEVAARPTDELSVVPTKGDFELPLAVPASIGTYDQAMAIGRALDHLGIRTVDLVTGGSLGGMIALALASLFPRRVKRVAPIAANHRSTAWIRGFNHVGRRAITQDPGFPDQVTFGLEIARQLAHLSYRAEDGLSARQDPPPGQVLKGLPFPVQTYLEHQGRKLRDRFDARAYLAQLSAMDLHDLSRAPPLEWPLLERDASWSLERLRCSVRAIGIDSDQLYSPTRLCSLTEELRELGLDADYREIHSPHGHDAFLLEWDAMTEALTWASKEP